MSWCPVFRSDFTLGFHSMGAGYAVILHSLFMGFHCMGAAMEFSGVMSCFQV